MKIIKFLAVLAALACLVAALSACETKTAPSDGPSSAAQSSDVNPDDENTGSYLPDWD